MRSCDWSSEPQAHGLSRSGFAFAFACSASCPVVAFAALVLYGLVAIMTAYLLPHLSIRAGAGLGLARRLLYSPPGALA
ncbi:MAG: hypothetical protein ABIQ16_04860 [Polyangiaceae bacterium]